MEKYIFMTNYYLPFPDATGMCVHKIAKELAKKHDVTTLCYESLDNQKNIDGVNILPIRIPLFLKRNKNRNKIYLKFLYMDSLIHKFIYIKKYPLRSNKLVREYIKKTENIISESDQTKIIASFTPLEAVIAAYKLKIKYPDKVKIIYYSTDTLSNEKSDSGFLPLEYREKCGLEWERKLFKEFDKLILMECHKEHYSSDIFEEFKNKMVFVNFPFMEKQIFEVKQSKASKKIHFVYAGTLYKIIRNPKYLCDALVRLSKRNSIRVDFLGGGDCNDILEEASVQSNQSIVFHGMQSHDVAMKYINNADVLLSIGNLNSPMVPSKIYEYMSTGKPIVHIYFSENDPCILPLKIYGNALIVHNGDKNADKKLDKFLRSIINLGYETIEEKFITSTPKYTAEIINNY